MKVTASKQLITLKTVATTLLGHGFALLTFPVQQVKLPYAEMVAVLTMQGMAFETGDMGNFYAAEKIIERAGERGKAAHA